MTGMGPNERTLERLEEWFRDNTDNPTRSVIKPITIIAKDVGLSVGWLIKAIKELEQRGIIKVIRSYKGNEYIYLGSLSHPLDADNIPITDKERRFVKLIEKQKKTIDQQRLVIRKLYEENMKLKFGTSRVFFPRPIKSR